MHVHDVMTVPAPGAPAAILTAHPEQELAEVLTILRFAGLNAMPVVEDGIVVGSVTAANLVRRLAPDDAGIAADIRCRLARYPRLGRWSVAVQDGAVLLSGDTPGSVERHLVEVLTGTVIGVTTVQAGEALRPVPTSPSPLLPEPSRPAWRQG